MISKFGKRTASITLIFIVCITMLFSGSGVSKVFAEGPTKPDIEVSNLNAEISGTSVGKVSFNVKINRKVRNGETIQLKFGYDKVDNHDASIGMNQDGYGALAVKEAGKSDVIVGSILASKDSFYLTFGKDAEKYDDMDLEIQYGYVYDLDSYSTDNKSKTMSLPIYITLNGEKVTKKDGMLTRNVGPAPTDMANHNNVFFNEKIDGSQSVSLCFYLGKGTSNPFLRSGKVVVTLPDSLDPSSINGDIKYRNCKLGEVTKPTGDKFLNYISQTNQENSFSLESIAGNKITFNADFDKFQDSLFHIATMQVKYKEGYSYKDGEKISVDYTGVGGKIANSEILKSKVTAGGTGTILDVSKYDLTADPIILHKGDKAPDNSAICDKVTIKDKADGKTVTAEEIGADKTRTDNNVIDTNKPGDYSATVTVQYKDKSVKNVTVPIKVIDNVIPVKPGEDGKNPEKPAGYKTVTMDPTSKGHLEEGEASQYYVNPEKEVTIPAKDAIGNLGYKFKEWKPALKGTFKEDTTITAQYANIDDVIPAKPGEDGKTPEKPAGYVTVTMDPTANGHLAKDEASEYYVNPEKEVTIPAKDAIGNVGYKFKEWKPALKGTFKADTTITAQYANIDDVIPVKPGEDGKNPEKPAGYVTVTMDPTDKGHLAKDEASKYYVNPEKEVTIPAKDAIGNVGYKFTAWDKSLKGIFKEDNTITAQYNKLPDVIPNVPDENGNKPTKPDGYVTIKVDPGENGKLDPRDSEEYFVNPNKDVTIPLHDAIANDGYKFSKWNPNNKGRFSKDMTIKAEYMKKKNIAPLTGDTEMLMSYAVLLAASAAIAIGFRRKRNSK